MMVKYTKIDEELFASIADYLDRNLRQPVLQETNIYDTFSCLDLGSALTESMPQPTPAASMLPPDLEEDVTLPEIEETFSQMLLRLIDQKGMTDPDVYHKAWVDRRLFSKIRSNPDYTPRKATAVSFALALELSPEEADELLMKAGYALSDASKWDLIIRYCIENKIFQIYNVNCILNEFGQRQLLG